LDGDDGRDDAAEHDAVGPVSYSVNGSYFESCNCDPICPCRMVDGVAGGRSTHGICKGVLAWSIEDGQVQEIDVAGLMTALVIEYEDDEPGSPWTIVLHVDERATSEQHAALAGVFLGRLGGPHVGVLPWVRKTSHLVSVRESPIALTPYGVGCRLRIGNAVRLTATRLAGPDNTVRCGIPGYEQPGNELVAEELVVHDAPFDYELAENCAYASRFAYSSE
jgi:hypothetical protein